MNNVLQHFILLCIYCNLLVGVVYSQGSCTRITADNLGSTTAELGSGLISQAITPSGESSVSPLVRIVDHNIVCEAQASARDRYRYTSVVVRYTCTSTDSRLTQCQTPGAINTEQFDFGCIPNQNTWTLSILFSQTYVRTANPEATINTTLEPRCGICANPDHAVLVSANISQITHCGRE